MQNTQRLISTYSSLTLSIFSSRANDLYQQVSQNKHVQDIVNAIEESSLSETIYSGAETARLNAALIISEVPHTLVNSYNYIKSKIIRRETSVVIAKSLTVATVAGLGYITICMISKYCGNYTRKKNQDNKKNEEKLGAEIDAGRAEVEDLNLKVEPQEKLKEQILQVDRENESKLNKSELELRDLEQKTEISKLKLENADLNQIIKRHEQLIALNATAQRNATELILKLTKEVQELKITTSNHKKIITNYDQQ